MDDKKQKQIADSLRSMGRKGFEVVSAYVTAVDEDAATMDVTTYDGQLEIGGVMLRAVEDEATGVMTVPELDSDVVIASVDGPGEWCIVRASKVAKVLVVIGDTKIEVSVDGIVMNGGDNGGLVVLSKMQENLDTLKTYCQALKSAIEAGLTAVGVGSAANGGTGKAAFDSAMASSNINFKSMENTKVKH